MLSKSIDFDTSKIEASKTFGFVLQKFEEFLRDFRMLVKFDLQHFCCGPKGCEIEVEYGEMMDAE